MMADQLPREHAHPTFIRNEPMLVTDQHLPVGFLMISKDILGTSEASFGHDGRIFALCREDLVAILVYLGACKWKAEKYIFC